MVLPGATLFPQALLPLHIFEPRYRTMLRHALERDRMFCVAMVRRGVEDWVDEGDFCHVAGLGLVRACVEREDGRSNLVLQGLARVRLSGFDRSAPFVVAELEELPSEATEGPEAARLADRTRALCHRFKERGIDLPPQLDQYLGQITEPGVLADVVANTFVASPVGRQKLLEERSETKRLRLLVRYLTRELQ